MTNAIKRLEERVKRISRGNSRLPHWLEAVAPSNGEIQEYEAVTPLHRGLMPNNHDWADRHQRMLEFQRKMRLKHPDMPLTIEEEMERGVQRLNANPWLRWREGLHDDPVVDKIVAQLSHEEWYHLSKAILAFEEANAAPDAVLTSASETLAGLPAEQRAAIEKVRRLYEEQRH